VGFKAGKAPGQALTAVALASLLSPLAAVLPFIDPGLARNADCGGLILQARREARRSRRRPSPRRAPRPGGADKFAGHPSGFPPFLVAREGIDGLSRRKSRRRSGPATTWESAMETMETAIDRAEVAELARWGCCRPSMPGSNQTPSPSMPARDPHLQAIAQKTPTA